MRSIDNCLYEIIEIIRNNNSIMVIDIIDYTKKYCSFIVSSDGVINEHEMVKLYHIFNILSGNKYYNQYIFLHEINEIYKSDLASYILTPPMFLLELIKEGGAEMMAKIILLFNDIGMCVAAADKIISNYESDFINLVLNMMESFYNNICPDAKLNEKEDDIKNISDNDNETKKEKLENLMLQLNDLVGLKKVKEEVNTISNLVKLNKLRIENGLNNIDLSLHLVFKGNPGTGKTTVARILGNLYRELGVLSSGHLIETDRSGLVGGYVGQTAIKTKEILNSAKGGVLFIDEAYSLFCSKGAEDYGNEAIDILLKEMEDNRRDMIVIVAGYPNEMDVFLNSNPGLISRFNRFINFEDYSARELYDIFISICNRHKYQLTIDAQKSVWGYMCNVVNKKEKNFSNARLVRNIFEKTLANHANRISSDGCVDKNELLLFRKEDLPI